MPLPPMHSPVHGRVPTRKPQTLHDAACCFVLFVLVFLAIAAPAFDSMKSQSVDVADELHLVLQLALQLLEPTEAFEEASATA